MNTKLIFFACALLYSCIAQAQNVGINTSGTSPDPSALLDIESSEKGFLPPRMTTTQRNAINNPATGLIIYNITLSCLQVNSGTPASPIWNCLESNNQEVNVNCVAGGFSGQFAAQTNFAGRSYSVTIVNNSFTNAVINFTSADLVLTGVGGMTVGAPTGVPALTSGSITLTAGQSVVVTYPITGAPSTTGTLVGTWTKLSLSCSNSVEVVSSPYPPNYNHCATATAIVDVTTPTGRVWMDRNLGASRAATSSADAQSYGSLFQWGRFADGHQCVNRFAGDGVTTSGTVSTLATTDNPTETRFITTGASPNDWRSDNNNNRWNATPIANNPCPIGYRPPSEAELTLEIASFATQNATGAYNYALKFPVAGVRTSGGALSAAGTQAFMHSTSINGTGSRQVQFASGATWTTSDKARGLSVRCIKEASATIGSLNCGGATHNGTLYHNITASGVTSAIPYTGANAGPYPSISVNSQGVTGLTASINAGVLALGSGTLTFTITGTPTSSGIATFEISVGGQSCTFSREVLVNLYPAGYNHCASTFITEVVEVTSPTGKVWMDRNLGAHRAATASNDAQAHGWLFQWGRRADGHQCINRFTGSGFTTSATTTTLATTDQPSHGNFIVTSSAPNDWRTGNNNNRWNAAPMANNPCPNGFRIPTQNEVNAEEALWTSLNGTGAYNSILKFTLMGTRTNGGTLQNVGNTGYWWTSTISGANAIRSGFGNSTFDWAEVRAFAFAVRCIKN